MRLVAVAAFGLGVLVGAPSFAATVDPIQGQVSVNRGDGIFRPITGTVQATIGDVVIVAPNGAARIVYPDGCTIEVKPGDLATIGTLSPCKAPSDTPSTDFSVAATLAVGAGVGGAILLLLSNKNDDKPASP